MQGVAGDQAGGQRTQPQLGNHAAQRESHESGEVHRGGRTQPAGDRSPGAHGRKWRRQTGKHGVAHPVHRTCVVEGPRVRLSRTPGRVTRAGPRLGEHTDVVLRDLLGYDDERIAELAVAGALD